MDTVLLSNVHSIQVSQLFQCVLYSVSLFSPVAVHAHTLRLVCFSSETVPSLFFLSLWHGHVWRVQTVAEFCRPRLTVRFSETSLGAHNSGCVRLRRVPVLGSLGVGSVFCLIPTVKISSSGFEMENYLGLLSGFLRSSPSGGWYNNTLFESLALFCFKLLLYCVCEFHPSITALWS